MQPESALYKFLFPPQNDYVDVDERLFKRRVCLPSLIDVGNEDTLLTFTDIADDCTTSVYLHNLTFGREVAQFKGAQALLHELREQDS